MTLKSLPNFKKPREKLFEKGSSALQDHELLAILLRTGYQGHDAITLAKGLLKKFSLKNLYQLPIKELSAIKGIGPSRATTISAALELSKRILALDTTPSIVKPADIISIIGYLRDKKKEHMVALYLDGRNRLIKKSTISIGIVNANLTHPREIFIEAIACNATSLILAHNHPSGNPEPSDEDIATTKRIAEAGELLGIKLKDHIILAGHRFMSMKHEGYM